MEQKWSIRPYREGDENGILELWKAVYPEKEYNRDDWMKWWRWLYQDSIKQIWVCEHRNKIVGQYPIIFMKVKISGQLLKIAQNIDLMTHPDYQHKGIFTTLEQKTQAELLKQAIPIMIGFPNEAAYPGHKKLGWFLVSRMQRMFKPLNWRNTLRLKVKNRLLRLVMVIGASLVFHVWCLWARKPPIEPGLTINQIASFDKRFDVLWDKVCEQFEIMVVRSSEYLNWRYSPPNDNYVIFAAEKDDQAHGYIVIHHTVLRGIKVSVIVDIIAQSSEVMHSLIYRATEECRDKDADMIMYSSITNKTYHDILKKNGFLSLPFIKGGYFSVYSNSNSISKEFLSDPRNWLIQIGDSDNTI